MFDIRLRRLRAAMFNDFYDGSSLCPFMLMATTTENVYRKVIGTQRCIGYACFVDSLSGILIYLPTGVSALIPLA
jgi:hypothetical protein